MKVTAGGTLAGNAFVRRGILSLFFACGGSMLIADLANAAAEKQDITQVGSVSRYTLPVVAPQGPGLDYANARAMPLPQAPEAPATQLQALLSPAVPQGKPSVTPGAVGSGKQNPVVLVPAKPAAEGASGVAPEAFGTSGHPFTTARVNVVGNATSSFYPYRAAGKLFFQTGSGTAVCTASLIRKGVAVTAAHCVSLFGANRFYTGFQFVPAYNNGTAPYGVSTAKNVYALTSYLNGTDSCATRGVVCRNDVAVIVLNLSGGSYVGTRTGFYGYGINGFGYNGSNQALINQLGYPVALDGGTLMQRTDSQGFVSAANAGNTIIGSLQTGGSSGGPWLVNLGVAPVLSGTTAGNEATRNVVVNVTSWGYTSTAIKQQGASPFTTGNIVALVNAACAGTPGAC